MIVPRFIGWMLLLFGLVVLGRDALAWHDARVFAPISLEQLWTELQGGSLLRFEAGLAPWLAIILHALLVVWATPAFVLLGFLLAWGARTREDTRRRRRRH
jgi:hypothetical protein